MSIILAQTDTTVGFLSNDAKALQTIKKRPADKQFLKVYPSLKMLVDDGHRVPSLHKTRVRRAKKTTFIINNQAIRVVKDDKHLLVLQKFGPLYSTSANKSAQAFDKEFCIINSDISIEDARGFYESQPSFLYALGKTKKRRIR